MWVLIFAGFALFSAGGLAYLIHRMHRFSFMQKLAENHKVLSWVLAALPIAAIGGFYCINFYAMFAVLLNLWGFWMIFDLLFWIIRKITKKERKYNIEGVCALIVTAIVLVIGWKNAHTVLQTDYTFTTKKDIGGDLRIVMFADSHLSITLDGEKFTKEMEKVQALNPDAVLICGDFVDDESEKDDMTAACRALGSLQTKYGVYFSFGNHDEGYFRYRNFTPQELRDALKENGIHVLEDENVLVGDRFWIAGRLDKSFTGRKSIADLTADIDRSKYIICMDHQPNDYAAEAEAGMDLVLSGHTHGGHLWPAGYFGLLIGVNDRVYGTERRGEESAETGAGDAVNLFLMGIAFQMAAYQVADRSELNADHGIHSFMPPFV